MFKIHGIRFVLGRAFQAAVEEEGKGRFLAEYDGSGALESVTPFGTNGNPPMDSFIYHAGLIPYQPPLELGVF